MKTDNHGQPVSTRLRAASLNSRRIDELIGICRGILFDDNVSQPEAEQLFKWLDAQPDLIHIWPASTVYKHLQNSLASNQINKDKNSELATLLSDLIGGNLTEEVDTTTGEIWTTTPSTALPLTNPTSITFDDRIFVLTGKFALGTRSECESEITSRGGECRKAPTKATNYVIIGSIGSRDWAHSSAGRKIQKAAMMRESGSNIEIISEEQWVQALSISKADITEATQD